nr:hypothetical protein [Bacteroidota bacterium]
MEFKEEGANTLFGIVVGAIVFSCYFFINIALKRQQYIPELEMPLAVVLSLLFWFFSRRYLVKKGKYKEAIEMYNNSNKAVAVIFASLLLVGQLVLFIYSGISLSKFIGH